MLPYSTTQPPLTPEQFRRMLDEALAADPNLARRVLRPLAGTVFPIVGGMPAVDTPGGTANYLPKFTDADTIANSQVFDNGTGVGIGTATPQEILQIGDRWTFHNGGFKIIGYNFRWSASQALRIVQDEAAALQFSDTGAIYLTTAPSGIAGSVISWTNALSVLNNGNVGIGTTDRLSRLTVKGRASFTATGTVSVSSGSPTTVTGSGTKFTQEVGVGDRVKVGTQDEKFVTAIASDTSLTVDSALSATSGQNMTVRPSIFRADDPSTTAPDNVKALVTDQGSLWLGNRLGFMKANSTVAANEFYRDSADFTVLRNFTQVHTSLQLRAPTDTSGTANREATLSLVRVDTQDNDKEYIDLYNNGYPTGSPVEEQYGIRIQKRGSGVYRDFVFDRSPGGTTRLLMMVLKRSGKIGIGIRNNLTAKLTVKPDSPTTGTVSVSAGSAAVTGTGTAFTQEVDVGDKITLESETRTVSGITDDTHLTVSSNFSNAHTDVPMTVITNLLRLDDASGNTQVLVTDQGNIGIGTTTPAAKVQIVGGDIYISDAGKGIILKSPDGNTCKRLRIDNSGNVFLDSVSPCP